MRSSATAIWEVVHDERRQLADDLDELGPEQWRTPSLCPGWDVHDVVAHLVDTARTGRLAFVRSMVAARMDFDRANEAGVCRERRADPSDTLDALRNVAGLTRTPPARLATRLVEAVVHGEDIRRPLGIARSHPPSAITRALAHQLRTPVSFGGGRERAAGLRLVDGATGTSWGEGDEVVADAIDLLLMVSGRDVEVG
ncbi:maleylpyruvate isomerase family mycothiol-dependent enzyme [Nocardioides pacificus]